MFLFYQVLGDKQGIKVEVKEVVAPKKENISFISTKDVTLEKEQKIIDTVLSDKVPKNLDKFINNE